MNIIIEGPDNSGKSTIAEVLARTFNMPVVNSPGPTKDQDAFDKRAVASLSATNMIFDRHCIVSESVYGAARGHRFVTEDHKRLLYANAYNLFIYCPGTRSLDGHSLKAHDSPEHLKMLNERFQYICNLYDRWAIEHAHIIWRKDQHPSKILNFVKRGL